MSFRNGTSGSWNYETWKQKQTSKRLNKSKAYDPGVRNRKRVNKKDGTR